MKEKFILIYLIISSFFTLPTFSEEITPTPSPFPDQALLYNQLMNQMQNTSPQEMEKATSDADLATLMEVMKLVENKNYRDGINVLENLLKKPKGKGLTPQSKEMIKNLIEVMKFMESQKNEQLE